MSLGSSAGIRLSSYTGCRSPRARPIVIQAVTNMSQSSPVERTSPAPVDLPNLFSHNILGVLARCRQRLFLSMMLDLLSFGKINSILADIRGQVSDALEISTHEQQLERRRDGAGILHHVRYENAKHRVVHRIDL